MNVIESYVAGKHPDPVRCEDVVADAGDLVAVIDGVTDKGGLPFVYAGRPVTGGRFAARTVADAIANLTAGTPAVDVVAEISDALAVAVAAQAGELPDHDRPGVSLVVYDAELEVVWRVGDCGLRIDEAAHLGGKRIDEVTSDFRAAYLATFDDADDGTGREVIMPLLRRQAALANRPGEFGYGVVNGTTVPSVFVEVFPVPSSAREVVLATDGYPALPATLADAEAELARRLAADPRGVAELRATKGLSPGLRSFDDRAWVRLRR